jgi:ABC-type multidrug transport system fused ATPase/permease subunit
VRKGEDIKDWSSVADKRIGVGAGSISWLKFAASVQENGLLGAGMITILTKVVFPSALPSIFTGLRLGIGVAWTAVIVAEMIAVKSGLGYVLWDAYYVGRMDICVATMFSVGLLGFFSDRIIVWAGRLAVQNIGLSEAEREFAAILGPSGCGKSTLLNMVAGFDQPTRGAVRVAGEEIVAPSPSRAVVFQEPALFPWLSVMENVVFGPKTQRQSLRQSRCADAHADAGTAARGLGAAPPDGAVYHARH